jgi:hypothetical protein
MRANGLIGIALFAIVLGPMIARQPANAAEATERGLETAGFVSRIDPGALVEIQRNGRTETNIVRSMALYPLDTVTVRQGAVELTIAGRQVINLPAQGRSFTIRETSPAQSDFEKLKALIRQVLPLFEPNLINIIWTSPHAGNVNAPQGPLRSSALLPPGHYFLSANADHASVFWKGQAQIIKVSGKLAASQTIRAAPGTSASVPIMLAEPAAMIVARAGLDEELTWRVLRQAELPIPYPAERRSDAADLVFAMQLLGLTSTPPPKDGAWRLEGLTRLNDLARRYFPAQNVLEALQKDVISY